LFNSLLRLHTKNVGVCICLFVNQAYHSLSSKQTEKHPRGSILYTVKCASEDMISPRSTLRRVYATPRGSHPCNVLDYWFDSGSSIRPKTALQ